MRLTVLSAADEQLEASVAIEGEEFRCWRWWPIPAERRLVVLEPRANGWVALVYNKRCGDPEHWSVVALTFEEGALFDPADVLKVNPREFHSNEPWRPVNRPMSIGCFTERQVIEPLTKLAQEPHPLVPSWN